MPLSAAVRSVGRMAKGAAVYSAFSRFGRRFRNACDPAVRWERYGGRNDRRDGPGAGGAGFGVCGAAASENDPHSAVCPTKTLAAHGDRRTAFQKHVSSRRAYRQREPAQRTGHGPSGDPDRPCGRPAVASDPVQKTFRKRDPVRGASAHGYAFAVRKRRGGLRLRRIARTARRGAGDPAGNAFTL